MKTLAATILDQRSETEQFFMEALNEVKEAINMEKKQIAEEERNQMRAAGLTPGDMRMRTSSSLKFPSLISRKDNFHRQDVKQGKRSTSPVEAKVRIKDLSWSDKELVLRVLFAKLNENKGKEFAQGGKGGQAGTASYGGHGGPEPPFFVSEGAGDFLPKDFQFQSNDSGGDNYGNDNNYNNYSNYDNYNNSDNDNNNDYNNNNDNNNDNYNNNDNSNNNNYRFTQTG